MSLRVASHGLAEIGVASTAGGTVFALSVIALQMLTGTAQAHAQDTLVLFSAVLIQTGVLLMVGELVAIGLRALTRRALEKTSTH